MINSLFGSRSRLSRKIHFVAMFLFIGVAQANAEKFSLNEADAKEVSSQMAVQQTVTVTGMVIDVTGMPMPGVTVMVSGTTNGTSTDALGRYSIKVNSPESVLEFSFVSYVKEKAKVGTRRQIDITLKEDAKQLEEVQVVAYGKQKKASVISSVTTISAKDLKVPSSNLTTAFAGRLSGVIAYQTNGEVGVVGENNNNYFVRGVSTFGASSSPLILIDGIESSKTDLARVQPDDIASFSIMKDATATALYGARGANGVMLVTTKEGTEGKAKVSIRLENTFSAPTSMVELADPITYMKLYNEAVITRNPLGFQPFSPDKIEFTAANRNQYAFPAVDWQKMLFKEMTSNQRSNFSVSGGGKVARYYIGGTYNIDNGALKVDGSNNFNNNIKLKTYQLRSNINLNVTKTTEIAARLSITMDDYTGPIDGGSAMYEKVMKASPVLFPAFYPKTGATAYKTHVMFGNQLNTVTNGYYINPYADMVKGYKEYSQSKVVSSFELKQNLQAITKGLNMRALFSTDRYAFAGVTRAFTPFWYSSSFDPLTDTYTVSSPLNPDSGKEYLDYNPLGESVKTNTYFETAINYDRTFDKVHGVSGMLVATIGNKENSSASSLTSSLPTRNMGVSGRFTYNFDSRYFIESNFGYNGSERFAKKNRFGFFPSLGVGYLISNEKFWQSSLVDVVNKLKLKATYGLVGNDNLSNDANDRFFYLSDVNMSNSSYGYTFGSNFNYSSPGMSINRYADENITWEKSKKLNLGFEIELFGAFELQADYFKDKRSSILMNRADIQSTLGLQTSTVRANVGAAESEGVDMMLDYHKNFKNGLWITSHSTFTFAKSKFTKYEEPDYTATPWRSRIGSSINQSYGFVAERLFVDDYDIANSPSQAAYGKYMAGDIKYKDINKDGLINDNDKVAIGYPTVPEINYGFGVSMGYKVLDFSIFFQGSARSAFFISPSATAPFVSTSSTGAVNQLLKVYADNHWSEDNRNLFALWPRLSDAAVSNNQQTSTWFMRDGTFMRLKNIEAGITVPQKLMKKIGMTSARFYYAGTNLLTFSSFDLWDAEMGGNGLQYPIQKTHTVGLQVSF